MYIFNCFRRLLLQTQTSQTGCTTADDQASHERSSEIHSDDEDNEICVVETDEKPNSSDDSYTHLTSGECSYIFHTSLQLHNQSSR